MMKMLISKRLTLKKHTLKNQKGLTLIEFTLVATAFFIVFFLFIELAIYLYAMQTFNDMSRKAARLGTVCYPSADISTMVTQGASLGISEDNIVVDYLSSSGSKLFDNPLSPSVSQIESIYYVRSRVVNYSFHITGILAYLGIGDSNGELSMPSLETVLPVQSLGLPNDYDPDNPNVDTCQN